MNGQDNIDIWKATTRNDVDHIEKRVSNLEKDVGILKSNDIKQDEKITSLQTTLTSIQDDTKWIRRMITKAIITATITGVIGGVIALFFAKL
ncbi:hemolysin XhlA family protein [Pontibacillus litoralis]|uniref:Protein xhlA n=1 Tax=Pontibacillus litoralis JSM 072002 TaxID=1385512 RepID=A0A0A5GA90_9BACI|nr:hemolysin XhlA family protein [Pontibacillus litoralis]KGX88000.1 protein xhlA [Pontibacillus litoralis JSM 072002]